MRLILGSSVQDFPCDLQVGWDSISANLPLVNTYDLIIVNPDKDTAAQQRELVKRLIEQLSLTSRTPKIIWFLNKHSITEVAELTHCGRIVALQTPQQGEVVSLLASRETTHIHFGFSQLKLGAMPIAHLGIIGKGRIIAGAVSPDENWILIPPTNPPEIAAWHRLKRVRSVLASLLLLPFLLATVALIQAQRNSAVEFASRLGNLWPAPSAHSIASHRLLADMGKVWRGAESHMVERILSSDDFFSLSALAPHLNPARSSFDLFKHSNGEVPAYAYFDLALLAGDGASAYRIVREVNTSDVLMEGVSLSRLTSTLWQTSVESLHELNLRRAEIYLNFYLSTAYDAPSYSEDLFPSRIKTLAQILDREFEKGNVVSFCTYPGIQQSFGRLNGLDPDQTSGYPIPKDDNVKGLRERREYFKPIFCPSKQTITRINYDKLALLEALNNRKILAMPGEPEVCRIADLECEYMTIRRRLEPGHPESSGAIPDMLSFARRCSYLSDDAVSDVIDSIPYVIASRPSERVAVKSLSEACRCFKQAPSDYRGHIAYHLKDAQCTWFNWDGSDRFDCDGLDQLHARCAAASFIEESGQ